MAQRSPHLPRSAHRILVALFPLASFAFAFAFAAPPHLPAEAASAGAGGAVARGDDAKIAFTIRDERITESSGLAVSNRHPGIVYTHNDSGGAAQVFAVGADGHTKATLRIAGAATRDWEAIALGPDEKGRPSLFIADIGDNMGGAWPYVTVYRVPEPTRLADQTLRATAFRLKYKDGPRNAEAMMVHPRTGRLYVASKLFGGDLYAAPARLRTGRFNVLQPAGDAPAIATDGAFSPDGRSLVLRTYFGAHIYDVAADGTTRSRTSVSLPSQEQGESIAFTADGKALLAGSEGVGQPVYRVPLPPEALPSPAADDRDAGEDGSGKDGSGEDGSGKAGEASGRTGGGNGDDGDAEGRRDSTAVSLGLFGALGVAGLIAYALFRRSS